MAPSHDGSSKDEYDDDEKSIQSPTGAKAEVVIAERDVANADFLEAVEKSERLNGFSRRSFKLYFLVMVGFMNAASSGFDGSLMGGINAMDQYKAFFNMKETGKSTGIVFMMYTIGNCIGSLTAGPFCDRLGRRWGMWIGGFFILLGAAVITSAQNRGQFLGGRFILGFGISISTTAAPTWVTELAPPQWRGRLGASYNACFFVGALPATGLMVGTEDMTSNWAWRLPLLLQVVPPIIVMSGVFFCPESPRWLVQKGRKEEAKQIMLDYHTNDGIPTPLIDFQIKEFEEAIERKKRTHWFDYGALVNTANARWRMLALFLMCWNGQLAGNGLITYYLPTMFTNAGITSSHKRLVLNFVNTITSCVGAFSGAAATDRIGRRPRLVIGAFLLAVMLTIVAVLSRFKDSASEHVGRAAIVFIFLFGVVYAFVYTPLQALYCAEVMNQEQRARGMGVHILISNCAGFINTFGNSVGLEKIGYKYYFVFVGWNLCASVLWYLFCVETRGRTLEELDEVFDQPWPAMASRKKIHVKVKQTGEVEIAKDATA